MSQRRLAVALEKTRANDGPKAGSAPETHRDFSAAVLDSVEALVVVLDCAGRIVRFNRACENLTGWSEDDVRGRTVWDVLIPPGEIAEVKTVLGSLASGVFPSTHVSRWLTSIGEERHIAWSNTALLDRNGVVEYVIGTGIDFTERQLAERRWAEVVQGVGDCVGKCFFQRLVDHLAKAQCADVVFVGELIPGDERRARILALVVDGKPGEPFEYSLAGTPCDRLIRSNLCVHLSGVREAFPDDQVLVDLDVDAYVGTPLVASDGRVLGLLVSLFRRPLSSSETVESTLRIFAARASAELERLQLERSLRESESFKSALLDNLCGMVYRCRSDEPWPIEFASAGCLELTGYPPEHFVGYSGSLDDLIVEPEERARVELEIQRAVTEGCTFELEYRIRTKSGDTKWVWEHGCRVSDGEREWLEGSVTDISDRKRYESELSASNRLLEAISRAQSLFIVQSDAQATFDLLLTELLRLAGSEYGFIGEVLETAERAPYLKFHAITNTALSEESRALFERCKQQRMEFRNLDTLFGRVILTRAPVIANDLENDPGAGGVPEGHPMLRSFLGVPFFDRGEIVGMVGVANRPRGYDEALIGYLRPFLDTCGQVIRAHRQCEEHVRMQGLLHQREEQLRQVAGVTTLGAMASSITHEVNQPLSVIVNYTRGCLQRLKNQGEGDAKLMEALENIAGQAMRAAEIIRGVERLAGRRAPRRSTAVLNRIVHDAVQLMEMDARVHDTAIRVHPGTDLPLLDADSIQLQQVLVNLIRNSLEALRDSTVPQREIHIETRATDRQCVEVIVTDNGPGVPEESLGRIFDSFFTSKPDGLGMGLAISRSIVEAHDGELNAVRDADGRTAFHILLPAHRSDCRDGH